jgi:hypothetical protein
MSLLNWGAGLSAAGSAISSFAGNAGLAQQKSDLEKQQAVLADQLATTRETTLAHVQGAEARDTATTTAEAQGGQVRTTAQFENTLPPTEFQKGTLANDTTRAQASMLEAKKPSPAGFGQGWLVPSKDDPSGYKVISITSANDLGPPDPTSDNLSKQIGLSEMGIHAATGDLNGRASIPYLNELNAWAVKNNKNIDTIKAQAKAINETLKATSERNQLGVIQEREIQGSIETITPILEDMNAGKINKANVLKIWAGGQVNDPAAMKAVDQLTRLKEELAGYNAIANAKITNGHPNPEVNETKAANEVITNGLNSGGLRAFGESIASSAQKNREILLKTQDDANAQLFNLFGGTYHKPTPTAAAGGAGGGATATPAPSAATAPAIPKFASPDDPDFKALPVGSKFMGPDGQVRIK